MSGRWAVSGGQCETASGFIHHFISIPSFFTTKGVLAAEARHVTMDI